LRHSKIGYIPGISSGLLSSTGVPFLDTQTVDEVYVANAIDGSTVTEFIADYPGFHINLSDPDGETTFQRLYARFRYVETTYDGLLYFAQGLSAIDESNYVNDVSIVDLTLKNINTAPAKITGGNMTRSNGTTIIASDSGSIQIDPGKAYLANASTLPDSLLAAMNASPPRVNVAKMNGYSVIGSGVASDLWRG
jgi:hypothetical protein